MDPLTLPTPLLSLLQQALTHLQQGKVQEALAHYRRVLDVDPLQFDALYGAGMLYGPLGDPERALPCFTAGCRVRSGDFSIHWWGPLAAKVILRIPSTVHGLISTLKKAVPC